MTYTFETTEELFDFAVKSCLGFLKPFYPECLSTEEEVIERTEWAANEFCLHRSDDLTDNQFEDLCYVLREEFMGRLEN